MTDSTAFNSTTLAAVMAGALGLALFVALYLFCSLKIRPRLAGRVPSDFDQWKQRLEQIEAHSRSVEQQPAGLECGVSEPSNVPVRPAMNMSRKSQALRLARRGAPAEQIAARVGMTTGEVRLLLKIHGMLVQQAVQGTHATGPLNRNAEFADNVISAAEGAAPAVQSR